MIQQSFRSVMRRVPSPVVVLTTTASSNTKYDAKFKTRGMTCSSFNSVSLDPTIISVSLNHPSATSNLVQESNTAAIHVLSATQVSHSVHFASTKKQHDFTPFPHYVDPKTGIPIMHGCLSVLLCKTHKVTAVGDHIVWFGEVVDVLDEKSNNKLEPLLFYQSSYRSIGDEVFMSAFESGSLAFEQWTHRAHLRMAFNYINEIESWDKLQTKVRDGIMRYNEVNKHLVSHGYNETITMFYLTLIKRTIKETGFTGDFDSFLEACPWIEDRTLLTGYYSPGRLYGAEAKVQFLPPDLKEM